MRLASLLDRPGGRKKAAGAVLTLGAMSRLAIAVEHSPTKSEKSSVIRIEDVCLSFGGVNALSQVSLDVKSNEILAIIGPT
jgi:ABC-type multidrug transport system fused ATPase/permease subunit